MKFLEHWDIRGIEHPWVNLLHHKEAVGPIACLWLKLSSSAIVVHQIQRRQRFRLPAEESNAHSFGSESH